MFTVYKVFSSNTVKASKSYCFIFTAGPTAPSDGMQNRSGNIL